MKVLEPLLRKNTPPQILGTILFHKFLAPIYLIEGRFSYSPFSVEYVDPKEEQGLAQGDTGDNPIQTQLI